LLGQWRASGAADATKARSSAPLMRAGSPGISESRHQRM
jgi:hypothetical protein